MEVMVPVMAPSAPCSPRTAAVMSYCYFYSSAPTSPTRASYSGEASSAAEFDFAFGFSGQLRDQSTPILAAADELFEGGRIRPLNTTPHPSILLAAAADDDGDNNNYNYTSTSRRSPVRRISPSSESQRGRSTRSAPPTSSSRRATRSLSPFRGDGGGGVTGDDEFPSSPPSPRTSMMRGCGSGSRKWRLKDFFLFRSASEGRAAGAGGKYTMLSSSSSSAAAQKVRGGGGGEGGSASMRKGRGSAASASDMPAYTVSRAAAAAEEMRRRRTTPLPFHRNSLFGYLRSNPAIHSISRKLSGNNSSSSSNRGKPSA